MSLSKQAEIDLPRLYVGAAEIELKKTLLKGPIPTWVSQDQLWLPDSMSSWNALARVINYGGPIWKTLTQSASKETILYVMAVLRLLVRASSVKITDKFVNPDTWARLKYRVACHQQLLEIVRLRMSSEELTTLNNVISKDDIFTVYVEKYTVVCNYNWAHVAKYFSAGLPAQVAEDSSSNSSASASPTHEMSESKDESASKLPLTVKERAKTGWWKMHTPSGELVSNSSASIVIVSK